MFIWLKKQVMGSPMEGLARSLYIRLDPSVGSRYDRLTLAIMRNCLGPESNCIDIGAHRGTILAEILSLAPRGTHYAFEPIPEHAQYLEKTFPTVKVHQLALSNLKQQITFVHDLKHPTRSGFKHEHPSGDEVEKITVQTDLLDNIIPSTLPIHFMKLDVEGAEYLVLQGAINTIRSNKPVIVFEHTPAAENAYGVSPEAMYDLLTQECSLHVFRLEDWLSRSKAMSRIEFKETSKRFKSLYFVAYP